MNPSTTNLCVRNSQNMFTLHVKPGTCHFKHMVNWTCITWKLLKACIKKNQACAVHRLYDVHSLWLVNRALLCVYVLLVTAQTQPSIELGGLHFLKILTMSLTGSKQSNSGMDSHLPVNHNPPPLPNQYFCRYNTGFILQHLCKLEICHSTPIPNGININRTTS